MVKIFQVQLDHKKELMRHVKHFILWIVFCEILSSCASTGKLNNSQQSDFEIIRGRKKQNGCTIVGQCYDFEKEKLAIGLFNVNGVIIEGNTGALIANVL